MIRVALYSNSNSVRVLTVLLFSLNDLHLVTPKSWKFGSSSDAPSENVFMGHHVGIGTNWHKRTRTEDRNLSKYLILLARPPGLEPGTY